MPRALLFAALLALCACAPSPSAQRAQRIANARAEARTAGPRQALDYALAVHAAHREGDYRKDPARGVAEAGDAIATLDRAIPSAGVDAPTLVAWRAILLLDQDRPADALSELERSFALGPNRTAADLLVMVYGGRNQPERVGEVCRQMVAALTDDDDRLTMIATCRKNMNAVSPAGEMAWMPPELVAWYQAENARRLGAAIEAEQAAAERERFELSVVREMEQCSATCKERGLTCQNRCRPGDELCLDRCVEINHACLDRCEAAARQQLGQ